MEKQAQTPQLPQNAVTSSVLTLEHLSMAMTNNFLLQYFDDERELLHNDCKIVELREEEMTIANGEYQYDVKFDDVKLILRAISDLRKEIEENQILFYPLEIIGKMIDEDYECVSENEDGIIVGKDMNPRCGHPYDCDCMSYTYDLFYKEFNFYSTIYQDGNPDDLVNEITHESYLLIKKLIEWHFDIFNLIEQNLAVSIHDVV
jgi:hypothetical protein